MHSIHQVRTLNGVAPHVQQQLIQQELSSSGQQQQELSMTVLETLEPAQTQQQQQQALIHHLAPAPLLHQLQPSSRQLIEQQQQQHDLSQQQQQQQQQELSQCDDLQLQQATNSSQTSANMSNGQRQQPQRAGGQQLDGIVADGGGPIVQWLLENYEIADGESLPRSTVYNHYLAHCRSLRMSSVNAASFGKLIRSVFVGLKTRRLGTRGHSKYHYFGVRAKQHVRFDWLQHHETGGTSSANSELGRAGCSSATMLRDSNCDTNSNCGSDGGGQCGSETDSTGNCSGRLSTSISGGHLNQSSNQVNGNNLSLNGKNATTTTTPTSAATTTTTATNLNNVHGNKRFKRAMQVNAATPDDHHYHHLQQQQQQQQAHHQEHNLEGSLDQHPQQQQHLQQMHYTHQQNEQSTANGLQQYHGMVQSNGYDKQQDLFACTTGGGGGGGGTTDEQGDFAQWSNNNNTQLNQYDLASLRNHLNLEKAATLVQDNWPEREPGRLERQLGGRQQSAASGTGDELESGGDHSQDCRLERLIEPFESQYKFHYKRLVELLSELNFAEVEQLWANFWRPQPAAAHWPANPVGVELNDDDSTTRRQQTNSNYDQQQDSTAGGQLTFGQLYELTSRCAVIERVAQIDQRLLGAIEKFLVVDMLSPLPRAVIQHLRSFARQVSAWQEAAVRDYSAEFVSRKVRSVRAFELALRRSTSINHLSAAARAIWSKRSVLSQMSVDLSRLDLGDLEHQVASLMNQEKLPAASDLAEAVVDQNQVRGGHQADSRHDLLQTTPDTKSMDGPSEQQQQQLEQEAAKTTVSSNNIQEANDNIENTYTSQQHLNSISSQQQPQQQQQQPNHLNHNSYNCTQQPNTTNSAAATANTNQTNNSNLASHHLDQTSPLQPGQLVQNFLHLLEDPFPLGQWPNWCRALVESRVSGRSLEEARNFILKWNFYISLILRELTLKSAPSLGSFQLIRLLFDEFMYYLVVSKLQQAAAAVEVANEPNSAKFHDDTRL